MFAKTDMQVAMPMSTGVLDTVTDSTTLELPEAERMEPTNSPIIVMLMFYIAKTPMQSVLFLRCLLLVLHQLGTSRIEKWRKGWEPIGCRYCIMCCCCCLGGILL